MQAPIPTPLTPVVLANSVNVIPPMGKRRATRWLALAWVLWTVVLLIVLVRAGLFPERNSVFGLFQRAGARWLAGERLYPNVGEFLYSPLAAAAFAPFALLPTGAAGVLWRLGSAAAYLLAAAALLRRSWANGGVAPGAGAQAAGLLTLLVLSLGNFNNGQASPVVIALLLGATLAAEAQRWGWAAAAIAAATFFKIYPLAVGLLLVALYPRQLGWRLALALLAGFGLSLLLRGPVYGLEQYRGWFRSLGADPRRLDGPFGVWRDAWLLLRLARVPITVSQYAAVQVAAGAAAASFCVWGQRARGWTGGRLRFAAFALGCGWVTLFGPSTESATYIFLAPALAYGTAVVISGRVEAMPRAARVTLWAAFGLLVAAEMLGAWVPAVRRSLWGHALQPLGGLCFVSTLVVWLLCDRAWVLPEPGRMAPEDHGRGLPQTPRVLRTRLTPTVPAVNVQPLENLRWSLPVFTRGFPWSAPWW